MFFSNIVALDEAMYTVEDFPWTLISPLAWQNSVLSSEVHSSSSFSVSFLSTAK